LLASPDGIPQDRYRVAHTGPAAFGEVAGWDRRFRAADFCVARPCGRTQVNQIFAT
jgi:hypothetical protein